MPVIDVARLAGRERERVEGYSRGIRQRLHIARGPMLLRFFEAESRRRATLHIA